MDAANLTNLVFLPQSAIELLIAENFICTDQIEYARLVEDNHLITNEVKLRRALNYGSDGYSCRHRRALDSKSTLYIMIVQQNNRMVRVSLEFPRVSFTVDSTLNGSTDDIFMEKKVTAEDLQSIIDEGDISKLHNQSEEYFD